MTCSLFSLQKSFLITCVDIYLRIFFVNGFQCFLRDITDKNEVNKEWKGKEKEEEEEEGGVG